MPQPSSRTQHEGFAGPTTMFWMWMTTIVVGFAAMIAVIGSGR